MADIEADGVVVSLDGGETYRFHGGSGSFSLTDLADQPTPYIARAAGPAFEGPTLAALKAPEFTSKPTITANSSTVGTTLSGTNGTWVGNPQPTLSRIFWLKNNVVIPNENGGTLSTATGFAVGDQIIRAVEIQSVINGETVKVTEYSLPFTLTAQPTLQATISPDPLVAGQPGQIVFSAALTAAPTGNVAFTGSGTTWSFTAPLDHTAGVMVSAKLAGYVDFLRSYDVSPAVARLVHNISDNTAEIEGLTASSPADTLIVEYPERYAASYPFDPANLEDGPIILKAPFLTGTGEVGTDVVLDLGLSIGATSWEGQVRVDGEPVPTWSDGQSTRFTVLEEHRGKALTWGGLLYDGEGGEVYFETDPINVPGSASSLVSDTFTLPAGTSQLNLVSYMGERGEAWVYTNGSLQTLVIIGSRGRVEGTGTITTGPNRASEQGAVTTLVRGTRGDRRGIGPMIRWSDSSGQAQYVYLRTPLFGTSPNFEIVRRLSGVTTTLASVPAPAEWVVGTELRVELSSGADNNGTLKFNDEVVWTGPLGLAPGGHCGLRSDESTVTAGGHEPTDFACWGEPA